MFLQYCFKLGISICGFCGKIGNPIVSLGSFFGMQVYSGDEWEGFDLNEHPSSKATFLRFLLHSMISLI